MIYSYAIDPNLLLSWAVPSEFKYFRGCFGLGTPRALLEIPKFTRWRSMVVQFVQQSNIDQVQQKNVEKLIDIISSARCRKASFGYDGNIQWLLNAEASHAQHLCEAVLACTNPRNNPAVILGQTVGQSPHPLWDKPNAVTPFRTPEALSAAISAMLLNCSELRLVDPHFKPETRFTRVLEAILRVIAKRPDAGSLPIEVHCKENCPLDHFKTSAIDKARYMPAGIHVQFFRWAQKADGEKLHNRYILTNLGGVRFGDSLDDGNPASTDDLNIMDANQFNLRWEQYRDGSTTFTLIDRPPELVGQAPPTSP